MAEKRLISQFTDDEFILILAAKLRMNPADARKVSDSFVDAVVKCVVENEALHIRKFGLFSLKQKKSAKVRNFKGEITTVPEYYMIRFNPSLSLKEKVHMQRKLRESTPKF